MKPLLFLDIDGVLNVLPEVLKTRKAPPPGFEIYHVGDNHNGRPVLVNKEIGEGLRSLSDDVEIRWLSHWNAKANRVGRLLGLPRLNFAALPSFTFTKAITLFYDVTPYAHPRPIIWVDDQCTERDVHELTTRLPVPYFAALKTDPAVGLRLQDIELIRSEISLLA